MSFSSQSIPELNPVLGLVLTQTLDRLENKVLEDTDEDGAEYTET